MKSDESARSETRQPVLPVGGTPSKFHFELLMPSQPRFLSVVRSMVSELTGVYGFADDQCRGITLAVDEALTNIIRHAYKNQPDQEIELHCHAYPDRLEFILIDRGEAVNPARICSQPLNESATGGRGTHLIRLLMDQVCYEQIPGGNQLRLEKYLPVARDES